MIYNLVTAEFCSAVILKNHPLSNCLINIRHSVATIFIASALIFNLSGCREETPHSVDPIAHNEFFDIGHDCIDLHNGVILKALSDSLMEVRVNENVTDSIFADQLPKNRMSLKSGYPLLDFLYRFEASRPSSGRYSADTPYEIFLNPLQNDSAQAVLESRLRHSLVIPYETRTLSWPAINSNAEWLLAASELWLANGDSRWERIVRQVSRNLIASDNRINRNQATRLFTGIPRYMANATGIFPEWMSQTDISQLSTLAVNIAYATAINNLDLGADSLVAAIKYNMWLPDKGFLSGMTYGSAIYPIALQSTDNLAQAIAIISGILPDAMSDAIISKTPTPLTGISLFQPTLPPTSDKIKYDVNSTLLQTGWAVAAASRGNEAAYSTAVGAIFAKEGERILAYRQKRQTFNSSITTLILRGFLGVKFSKEGIHFSPYIPENLPGEKEIKNLHYRDAILDIKITGTGKAISTFTIDGNPAEPFFNKSLKGKHSISITLAGASADLGRVNITRSEDLAPLPPTAKINNTGVATLQTTPLPQQALPESQRELLENNKNICRQVYINGILQEQITTDTYRISDKSNFSVIQFTTLSEENLSGFSSQPYIFTNNKPSVIDCSTLAKTGTKLLKDKKLASKFVETSRSRNRNISFDFDAPHEGRYLIDVRYANGLRLVNNQRKTALRSLKVNNSNAGIFIFPQLTSGNIRNSDNESWQKMTDWSNPLIINLDKGLNKIELRYYQPSPVYIDPNANILLFDAIRLTDVDRQ